jgi:hypothetical protein
MRAVTAIALGCSSLVCLMVAWFGFTVALKGLDPVPLGLALVALACIAGMWFAFARRLDLVAWFAAAAPVALVVVFLATFKLRMF